MEPVQDNTTQINTEELLELVGAIESELEEPTFDLFILPLITPGDESITHLAVTAAVLALMDPLVPSDQPDIDPTLDLCAYLSSPEFISLEGDIGEAGMREFDDRVRRGLDPITGECGVVARLLEKCVLGAVAVIDSMAYGLLRLRSMLMASIQGIRA